MGKFFSRFRFKGEGDPTNASFGSIASFYSLLIFLICIPFVLIVALVWLTGVLGFNAYIFAGFVGILGIVGWRLYRSWGRFKQRLATQSGEFQEMVREATASGKDVEISLLNGVLTLRYKGRGNWPEALPQAQVPLALAGPQTVTAEAVEANTSLPPERLRQELEEFMRLRDEGVITAEEFDRIKAGLLEKMST
ncbi:MAG: SHOCT domain-containing protein [Deltaproteobacteria bacterium]|nr:SHOCT domain-containing protein [Deltaproteobacteria bacterium]